MKSKLLIIALLISSWCFAQSVPNTNTFRLSDVTTITGGTTLGQAFANSVDAYFDPTYKGTKDRLSNFRHYTVCPDVGTSFQGGILAYKFVLGDAGYVAGECHGIVVSNADLTYSAWGCEGTLISGADGTAIGTGAQNTLDIIAGCATAGISAKLCADYSSGGYSDWFLPSKDELQKLYDSGISGFTFGMYSCSTEYSSSHAWELTWISGTWYQGAKNTANNIRAIRYF